MEQAVHEQLHLMRQAPIEEVKDRDTMVENEPELILVADDSEDSSERMES